eukprot:TRINITY_DN9068_c0_g1_i4.p1 TRINITY_DN9068_c0_g1~~TRINITY_DN9068_c0_g1_i4.p1  ORF type:complete len:636 (+),score=115.68 TRINITY_DN9068_c0_g1_i4:1042-2949(+)
MGKSYLSKRKVAVEVEGTHGVSREFKGGVPQGTVLAPLLFTIYVDDLTRVLEERGICACTYADDIMVVVEGKKDKEVEKKAQLIVDLVEQWAERWSMQLAPEKSNILCNGVSRKLKVSFGDGTGLKQVDKAKYLGVTLDANASFEAHVGEVKNKTRRRLGYLYRLSSKKGGLRRDMLRAIYLTYVFPLTRYGLGVYGKSLRKDLFDDLNELHETAARFITGLPGKISKHIAVVEAGLQQLDTVVKTDTLLLYEECIRKSNTVGCVAALAEELDEDTWAGRMRRDAKNLDPPQRECTPVGPSPIKADHMIPPWHDLMLDLRPYLIEDSRRSDPKEKRLEVALRTIAALPKDSMRINTDGTSPNNRRGGAAAVMRVRGKEEVVKGSAGEYCSSFRAETKALLLGLRGAAVATKKVIRTKKTIPLILLTDSQSLILSLQKGPQSATYCDEVFIWQHIRILNDRNLSVTIQYIPAHVGVEGNERADEAASKAAKEHTTAGTHYSLTDYRTTKSYVKRMIYKEWRELWEDSGKDKAYRERTGGRFHSLRGLASRRGEIQVMRLRAGQSELTRGYLRREGAREVDVKCTFCGEVQNLTHLLSECRGTEVERARHLGSHSITELLTDESPRVESFLKEIGLL